MDVEVSKRSRNFTDYDRNLLFELVIQYKHVLENKRLMVQVLSRKMKLGRKLLLSTTAAVKPVPEMQNSYMLYTMV
ncbi:hypothetical protein NQ314_018137 [Rhamnusium bicolor]|uniref:Uncharacterized protein n=1 Tax=Rhamnusium bicolor TaxID=1586634 RepID=A0AAV8WRP6_9CUCU|nr:hypothetical protein NQ314_018137 [Rhamnusium bicolor]